MRRGVLWLAALAATTILAPGGAAAPTGPHDALVTPGPVTRIAADSSRVPALTSGGPHPCARVVVWEAGSTSSVGIGLRVGCGEGGIDEVREIALAGVRIAWIEAQGGNQVDLTLKSRPYRSGKASTVAFAHNDNGAEEDADGDYVGHLFGHSDLLAFNSWSLCTAYPASAEIDPSVPHCDQQAPGSKPALVSSNQKLLTIAAGRGHAIRSAADALDVVGVGDEGIATQQPNGVLTLFSSKGAVLERIAGASGTFSGVAFQGTQLARLRNGKLELYDFERGRLVETLPLPAGQGKPVLRDLQDDLAVYLLGRSVHVVRVTDGKSMTITPPGAGAVDAQLEAPGLFYSYNQPQGSSRGRVVFIPDASLVGRLG